MSKKVYSYDLDDKQVTFAFFKKEEAEALFNIIKNASIKMDPSTASGVAVGRVLEGAVSKIVVVQFDLGSKTSKILDIIDVAKIWHNKEMRKIMNKYNLLD